MQSTNPILVTGASGFIASHIIKLLLTQNYKVRGTVRSLANKQKYEFLYNLVPEKKDNLELVEADLSNKETWPAAVEGCDYIFHVASPIPAKEVKHERDLIEPAVAGTLNVLEAALEKGAKKVVVTSGCSAIINGNVGEVTEENWSDESKCGPYAKSKVQAEKSAWTFYEKNKDKIQVTVVNPSLVLGPVFTQHGNSSETLIAEMMKGNFPGIPEKGNKINMVDVRDVAVAHVNAMWGQGTDGKRYICSGGKLGLGDIIGSLKKEFGGRGYRINDKIITPEEAAACGIPIVKTYTYIASEPQVNCNSERSVKELGMTYLSLDLMLKNMGESLINQGVVPQPNQN